MPTINEVLKKVNALNEALQHTGTRYYVARSGDKYTLSQANPARMQPLNSRPQTLKQLDNAVNNLLALSPGPTDELSDYEVVQ